MLNSSSYFARCGG